ncbi:MAG: efflux RND transporter periplasmic adaptor subunit [Bacteroidota bacterium]|nr:efflux RND transporter periplasmic adaptor subunit [Bacteroidota bacterium]
MKKTSKITTYVITMVMIFVIATGCNKNVDKKTQLAKLKKEQAELSEKIQVLEKELIAEGKADPKIVQVALSEVKPQLFEHYIEVQGKVDGDDNVTVTAKTMGVLTRILVKPGDVVRKNQVLAEVDASVLKSTLDELRSSYTLINNLFEKQKTLWDQKIGTEVQYLTAKNNKESMEKRIATLQEQIELTRIVSPISGSVEDVPVKVGQAVSPGFTVFRVVNFSKIKISADIAEAYAAKVKKDNVVKVYFPDIQKDIDANVSFASKFINPINRTFTVEARLSGDHIEYKANMIAVVKVNDYINKEAIVVPVNVIQNDPKGKFIYVSKSIGNKLIAKKQYVKEGLTYNGMVEIKEGIAIGDKVISNNFQNVEEDGQIKL